MGYFPAATTALSTAGLTPASFNWISASVDVSNWHLELVIFAMRVASSMPTLAIFTMSSFRRAVTLDGADADCSCRTHVWPPLSVRLLPWIVAVLLGPPLI